MTVIVPELVRHAVPARLCTARLELRRDEVADAEALLCAVEASRAELAPWLDWLTPSYDLAEARRGQRRAREYWDGGDSFQWRLWLGAEPAKLVGSIDLHTIDWDQRTAELGYWLDSRATGHGYMAEAGREVLAVTFERLGMRALGLRCHPANARSLATARRLGFVEQTSEADGIRVFELRNPAQPR